MMRAAFATRLCATCSNRNGHIGFNEPGSSFDSETRVVTLTPETRHANGAGTPSQAITRGIATILRARRIVLVADEAAAALLA